MNRRAYLRWMGAVLAGAAAGFRLEASSSSTPSLKQLARSKGLYFGSESNAPITKQPPAYAQLFLTHCDLFVAQTTWQYIGPSPGVDNFSRDPNIPWVSQHGLMFTGGHLLWPKRMPAWLNTLRDKKAYANALSSHIEHACKTFPGKVFSWNVVNEVINPKDGRIDGLTTAGAITTQLGPNFVDDAFHRARQVAPKSLLIYNDFDFELNTIPQENRRTTLLHLIEGWKKRGVPIDAIGLQTHMRFKQMGDFNEKVYRAFLKDIASFGLKIMITEFDVLDIGSPSPIEARDKAIADIYRRVLSVALDEPATCALITWGMCDQFSWYNIRRDALFSRRDGTDQRPLPFDNQFHPKPQFQALVDVMQNAPSRKLVQLPS